MDESWEIMEMGESSVTALWVKRGATAAECC